MKRYLVIISILSVMCASPHAYAAMTDYCAQPFFTSSAVQPNLLLVIDVSGSMSCGAYYKASGDPSYCEATAAYDATKTYEGYFDPSKYYKLDINGIYEETTPTGAPCVKSCTSYQCRTTKFSSGSGWCDGLGTHGCSSSRYGCCSNANTVQTGDCGLDTGNHLNYTYMARADLVRWVMTGGNPASCTGTNTFTNGQCNPELWQEPGNDVKVGAVCNNSLDVNGDGVPDGGCILMTDGRIKPQIKVKVRWDRVYDGLAFQMEGLTIKPRMAAMFFDGSQVRNEKVYMGDFKAPNTTSTTYPYMNLITDVNSTAPLSSTPTGEAMTDALNYYQQSAPQYNGFPVQSGSGDRWKNPMYICDGGGTNCTSVPCAQNYVLLMSDGDWNGSIDPVIPAYNMHKGFTNSATGVATKITEVYSIGLFLSGNGLNAMKYTAMYGSFDNTAKTWPDAKTGYPSPSSLSAFSATSSSDWDADGDNLPDTFFSASNALEIKESIITAVLRILQRVSSGTAASMLSSSEGSGANLLQAVFYPSKPFTDESVSWVGEMQNLWYYIDPMLSNSSIREDYPSIDNKLSLTGDYNLQFFFDTTDNQTKVKRYRDTDGNGSGDTYVDKIGFDDTHPLWRAGALLHARDIGTSPRTLYTNMGGRINFSTANAATLQTYLQAANVTEATDIINYIHGTDKTGYRNRTATYNGRLNTWKLGDIITSTPKVQSSVALNAYHADPPKGYQDTTYNDFITSTNYKTRGMVYAGANDGMLHAFKLGLLDFTSAGTAYKAQLCDDTNGNGKCDATETSTANLGQEQWGFIPKNALPYLRYLTDPNYCHLYYVDAPTYLVDASVNMPTGCAGNYWDCAKKTTVDASKNLTAADTSWRSILIGGMGLGGACRDSASTCTDCVKAPMAGTTGFSSYFALDVTDPGNPQLLWEFSDPALGFSTSGPAIVRIGDKDKNGRWFAVFASGPTGPIDTTYRQFMGRSDQNLKLFVLDLKTGSLVRTIDTGIANAFGGSLFNATLDADRRAITGAYNDDVIYLGYTTQSGTTWTDGGILRLLTKNPTKAEPAEDQNPANWTVSTVISGVGPVTTNIAKLQDTTNHQLWLYFGSGRYFYKTNVTDDASGQRALYGVQEQCYTSVDNIDKNCSAAPLTTASLQDQTTSPSATLTAGKKGWFINLGNPRATGYGAERTITNTSAGSNGVIFFTTFAPSTDICGMGGGSYIWAVTYQAGTSAASALKGTALLQVSTGEIKEIALKDAFTEKDSRSTSMIQGVPPQGSGTSIIVQPSAMKKTLHIRER